MENNRGRGKKATEVSAKNVQDVRQLDGFCTRVHVPCGMAIGWIEDTKHNRRPTMARRRTIGVAKGSEKMLSSSCTATRKYGKSKPDHDIQNVLIRVLSSIRNGNSRSNTTLIKYPFRGLANLSKPRRRQKRNRQIQISEAYIGGRRRIANVGAFERLRPSST